MTKEFKLDIKVTSKRRAPIIRNVVGFIRAKNGEIIKRIFPPIMKMAALTNAKTNNDCSLVDIYCKRLP